MRITITIDYPESTRAERAEGGTSATPSSGGQGSIGIQLDAQNGGMPNPSSAPASSGEYGMQGGAGPARSNVGGMQEVGSQLLGMGQGSAPGAFAAAAGARDGGRAPTGAAGGAFLSAPVPFMGMNDESVMGSPSDMPAGAAPGARNIPGVTVEQAADSGDAVQKDDG